MHRLLAEVLGGEDSLGYKAYTLCRGFKIDAPSLSEINFSGSISQEPFATWQHGRRPILTVAFDLDTVLYLSVRLPTWCRLAHSAPSFKATPCSRNSLPTLVIKTSSCGIHRSSVLLLETANAKEKEELVFTIHLLLRFKTQDHSALPLLCGFPASPNICLIPFSLNNL